MSRDRFDIAIVGGGLCGASLAYALRHLPIKIAVIEKRPQNVLTSPSGSQDLRLLALAASSQRIFEGIGFWPAIADCVTPIRNIHVSQQGHLGCLNLRSTDHELADWGFTVEASVLQHRLWQALLPLNNVTLMTDAVLEKNILSAEGRTLTLLTPQGQQQFSAELVVAADGAASLMRDQLGIAADIKLYPQSAIVTNVYLKDKPSSALRYTAFERLTRNGGILAVLPLAETERGIVWALPSSEAENLMLASEAHFVSALQEAFGFRLGYFSGVGARQSYPLRSVQAQQLTQPHLILIGNAAHTLHPVAAQGLSLGLRDVAVLAELISDALKHYRILGEEPFLQAYTSRRFHDHRRVMQWVDYAVRLGSSQGFCINTLRSLGMLMLNSCRTFNGVLMRRAMGWVAPMPRLLCGLTIGEDAR